MTNDYVPDEREGWLPHLQTVHRQFYEHADDRCLLWVNPAQSDPFADDPLVEERRVRVPIQHPNFDVRFAPYLVPLDLGRSADADVFKRSVARAWNDWKLESLAAFNGQAIGGWIACNQAALSLANYWVANCYLHRVNGLTKLLRFHDPSVREWLWPMLTQLQQRKLLGPAAFITSFNRRQELLTNAVAPFHNNLDSRETGDANDVSLELFLTDVQWAQVDDYAVVHKAWLRYWTDHNRLNQTTNNESAWFQKISQALRAATRHGVSDVQDRELFAWQALLFGTEFHEHERMRPVWKRTKAGDYYGSACEEVSGGPVDKLMDYLQRK